MNVKDQFIPNSIFVDWYVNIIAGVRGKYIKNTKPRMKIRG
jgi:hypothetical protein